MRVRRRCLLAGGLAAAGCAALTPRPVSAHAGESRFLRIGTGNVNGTYYRIGGLIAEIVGSPPGSRPCERGGSCGVPGLVAVAQSSTGSVANVLAIEGGEAESGFAQGDVAHFALTGTGVFAGRPAARRLRTLANLYPESVHLVVRPGSGIAGVADLRGKRVSLDAEGSGTLVDARLVLDAFGLGEADIAATYTPLGPSIDQMREGRLDAFFLVAGWPAPAVSEVARDVGVGLVPLAGPAIDALLASQRFFARDTIPADAYPGVPPTPTIAVGAQWLVSDGLDADLVHGLLTALWHPSARERLDAGHPKGASIRLETALAGVTVPLHPGAERYYRERGLLP
jgi:TRAP transporter TAXI family solute receptor